MAAKVRSIWRPDEPSYSAGAGEDPLWSPAQHLLALIDMENNRRRMVTIPLKESDYTGLIAEFVAGSTDTILAAALTGEIATISDVDNIPAAPGAAVKIGASYIWP